MGAKEDFFEVKSLRQAMAERIPVADFAQRVERLSDSPDDKTAIQALKIVAEVLAKDDTPIDQRVVELIKLCLKYADNISEIEHAVTCAGVRKTTSPTLIRQIARDEGLELPHIRKEREQKERAQLAAELPNDDELFDELKAILVSSIRTGTAKEKIAASQELNRLMEYSTEGYHQARAKRKAGEMTDSEIAEKVMTGLTGAS